MTDTQQELGQQEPHDADRYPMAKDGLQRILDLGHWEDVTIDRLEVRFLANGDATYRYFEPRADESDGGYVPGP